MNSEASRKIFLPVVIGLVLCWMAPVMEASGVERGGGKGSARASARTSINRPSVNHGRNASHNVNRNTNVNRNNNINVNRNVHVDVDNHYDHHDHWNDWDDHYHPIATAAAVTATVAVTSAVIGSIVNTVPSGCATTIINGIAYQQCGSTWYEPRYSGSNVQYIVVTSPR